MPASVRVVAGPAGSGKTESLLARYRDWLRREALGALLWISPTHRSAAAVRRACCAGNCGLPAPGGDDLRPVRRASAGRQRSDR